MKNLENVENHSLISWISRCKIDNSSKKFTKNLRKHHQTNTTFLKSMSENHKKITKNVQAYIDVSKNSIFHKNSLDQNARGETMCASCFIYIDHTSLAVSSATSASLTMPLSPCWPPTFLADLRHYISTITARESLLAIRQSDVSSSAAGVLVLSFSIVFIWMGHEEVESYLAVIPNLSVAHSYDF